MSKLPRRNFGKTGETCTALSLGGGWPVTASFDRAVDTVHRALELGIDFFDTSVLYRQGSSQAIMGQGLETTSRQHLLATKVGYFRRPEHFRSIAALHVQLQENLRLLRRDSVDLLQMHEADWELWWTDRSDIAPGKLFDREGRYDFANAPVIQFLREAKAQGLCRYIGITGNNARHLGRVIQELTGIDSVLLAYNYQPLNVTAREHVIPQARAKGMAVLIAGIFTFAFSLPKGWRTEGTYFGKNSEQQLAALLQLQQKSGMSMTELVTRFVAADEGITSVLVGSKEPHEIEQNVASWLKGPLPADLHAAVEKIAAQFE